MSWLYTVVFTGLMMSSQGGDAVLTDSVYADADAPIAEYASIVSDERESFEQTYPLMANGRVRVSNVNGSITVGVWDRNEVKVEYVKTADTRERLDAVSVEIESRGDSISVETDYGNWKQSGGENWRSGAKLVVDIKLTVPRGANLNEIETVNGSISVSDITNFAKVSAVNGTIVASGLRGTARLSTVNGEVNAEFDRLESSSRISLETVNGRVNLTLPSDSNATIKADSVNGNISNEFGLPVRKGKYVGRDLHGRIGSGETQIRLNSVNGVLSIKKKNDGKTASPATNLLSPNNEDGDVEYQTPDGQIMAPKPPTPPRAPRAPKAPPAPPAGMTAGVSVEAEVARVQAEVDRTMRENVRINADAIRVATETLRSKEMQETIRTSIATGIEVGLGALSTSSSGTPVVVKRANTFTVTEKPTVTVKAKNCTVVVRSVGNGGEVKYRVTRVSASPRENDVEVIEKVLGAKIDLDIKTAEDDHRNRYYDLPTSARIEISVPQKTDLDIQTSGEIRVENVTGTIALKGSEGAVNVRETEGDLSVRSSDGRIRVLGHRGNVIANSADGEITLDGDFKTVNARSADGDVNLVLPSNASATIVSRNSDFKMYGFTATEPESENQNNVVIGGGRDRYEISTGGSVRVRARDTISVAYN